MVDFYFLFNFRMVRVMEFGYGKQHRLIADSHKICIFRGL